MEDGPRGGDDDRGDEPGADQDDDAGSQDDGRGN
jgi:hypothetical protein